MRVNHFLHATCETRYIWGSIGWLRVTVSNKNRYSLQEPAVRVNARARGRQGRTKGVVGRWCGWSLLASWVVFRRDRPSRVGTSTVPDRVSPSLRPPYPRTADVVADTPMTPKCSPDAPRMHLSRPSSLSSRLGSLPVPSRHRLSSTPLRSRRLPLGLSR